MGNGIATLGIIEAVDRALEEEKRLALGVEGEGAVQSRRRPKLVKGTKARWQARLSSRRSFVHPVPAPGSEALIPPGPALAPRLVDLLPVDTPYRRCACQRTHQR
jgi:hypothetical protein